MPNFVAHLGAWRASRGHATGQNRVFGDFKKWPFRRKLTFFDFKRGYLLTLFWAVWYLLTPQKHFLRHPWGARAISKFSILGVFWLTKTGWVWLFWVFFSGFSTPIWGVGKKSESSEKMFFGRKMTFVWKNFIGILSGIFRKKQSLVCRAAQQGPFGLKNF